MTQLFDHASYLVSGGYLDVAQYNSLVRAWQPLVSQSRTHFRPDTRTSACTRGPSLPAVLTRAVGAAAGAPPAGVGQAMDWDVLEQIMARPWSGPPLSEHDVPLPSDVGQPLPVEQRLRQGLLAWISVHGPESGGPDAAPVAAAS